jgi:hypothetical protein
MAPKFSLAAPDGVGFESPLSAIAKIISKYAAVCLLLLLFPMQRLFEIASIGPSGVSISACASCTEKSSQAQSWPGRACE